MNRGGGISAALQFVVMLQVFSTVFILMGLFEWILLVVTLLPFGDRDVFRQFTFDLLPEALRWRGNTFVMLFLVYVRLAQTFLFGITMIWLSGVLTVVATILTDLTVPATPPTST